MDISKLCRSCMKEVASWEVENFNHWAVEMFSFCTNIEITDEDKLPKQFCYDCTIKIESSYTYVKKAMEVDITLKNIISRTTTSIIVDPRSQYKNILTNDLRSCTDSNTDARTDNNNEVLCFNDMDGINSNHSNDFLNDIKIETNNNPDNAPKIVSIKKNEPQIQNILEKTTDEIKKMCPICKKVFMLDKWLNKHMEKQHSSPKLNEDIIEKRKNGQEVVGKEKQEVVGKEKQECPLCQKIFTSKLWFSRHMEKEHSENKIYFCAHCPSSFPTHHLLGHHERAHPEQRRFVCDACGKRFQKRKQLAKHGVTHRDARPYECHLCHMTFKIKSILTCHLRVHENKKPFLCYICGRSVATAGNLQQHMSVHSGARPHACAHAACPYRAATAAGLRRHARLHRGHRPHACARCHKRFYDTGSLARHVRTHTGERPFQCPRCARAFADGWKRKVHLMRAHGLALADIPRMTRDGAPAPP